MKEDRVDGKLRLYIPGLSETLFNDTPPYQIVSTYSLVST